MGADGREEGHGAIWWRKDLGEAGSETCPVGVDSLKARLQGLLGRSMRKRGVGRAVGVGTSECSFNMLKDGRALWREEGGRPEHS
jgi:hypothetical protein